jgi:hypothetical protein
VSGDSNFPTRGIQKEHALVELSARRTVTIADFEPQFGNLCMVYASTPELGGGSVTGVLERVNDATIAVRATSLYGGSVQRFPGDGQILVVNITRVEARLKCSCSHLMRLRNGYAPLGLRPTRPFYAALLAEDGAPYTQA